MKIQELRIGNKVSFKDTVVEIAGVSGIAYSFDAIDVTIFRVGKTEMHDLKTLSPIPLTEDILLKCGFQPKYFGIKTYYSPLMELDHDFHLMGVDYGVKIKHLHQLQNLYFALTGKELEVEL